MSESRLSIMISYAQSFIGVPYRWGGEHPSEGFDCSAFVQEALAAIGADPLGDQTAQTLYDTLQNCSSIPEPQAGAILVFGKSGAKISHVAIALDEHQMIEAGGGNRTTKTLQRAIEQRAFVRIRPIKSRSDLIDCLLPNNLSV